MEEPRRSEKHKLIKKTQKPKKQSSKNNVVNLLIYSEFIALHITKYKLFIEHLCKSLPYIIIFCKLLQVISNCNES